MLMDAVTVGWVVWGVTGVVLLVVAVLAAVEFGRGPR